MLAESVNALPIYYPTRRVIVKALASCHALSNGKLIFCQGWLCKIVRLQTARE